MYLLDGLSINCEKIICRSDINETHMLLWSHFIRLLRSCESNNKTKPSIGFLADILDLVFHCFVSLMWGLYDMTTLTLTRKRKPAMNLGNQRSTYTVLSDCRLSANANFSCSIFYLYLNEKHIGWTQLHLFPPPPKPLFFFLNHTQQNHTSFSQHSEPFCFFFPPSVAVLRSVVSFLASWKRDTGLKVIT